MADDSIEVNEPLNFHPCNTPRGCLYYNTNILTDCQQLKLNDMKIGVVKSDEKYLRKHPEIRGFIVLITRHVFKKRPHRNIAASIKEFFDRPHELIEIELDEYLKTRPHVEQDVEEEEFLISDDYQKYLQSMQSAVEEKPSTTETSHVSLKEVDTESYIRQLLIDRIRTFPSKHEECTIIHDSTTMSTKSSKESKRYRKYSAYAIPDNIAPIDAQHLNTNVEKLVLPEDDINKSASNQAMQAYKDDNVEEKMHEIHKDLLNSVRELKSTLEESLTGFRRSLISTKIGKSKEELKKKT